MSCYVSLVSVWVYKVNKLVCNRPAAIIVSFWVWNRHLRLLFMTCLLILQMFMPVSCFEYPYDSVGTMLLRTGNWVHFGMLVCP